MPNYLLPTFMIMGGVKCGTSSVYRYLTSHPDVLPCKRKEPNYFSFRPWYQIPSTYSRYKKMFPKKDFVGKVYADWLELGEDEKMHASQFFKEKKSGQSYITGEATATTFFAANPRVIKFLLPKIKLIMLIRNPTDRYVSQYRMYDRFKREGRKGYDFDPLAKYLEEEIQSHKAGRKTRILDQGLYEQYLEKWEKVFGLDSLLLLKTSEFEDKLSAQKQLDKICEFLEVSKYDFGAVLEQKYNRARKAIIPEEIKEKLDNFYQESLSDLSKKYAIQVSI